jgi:hypothetical protein
MELSLVTYSFYALALYSSRHIMMLPELVIPLLVVLFLPIVFFLVVPTELHVMALVTTEVTWLRWLLEDFGISVSMPTPLLFDSTGAINIARDPIKHELTKYIGVDAHFRWSQIQDGVVALQYVPSEF